MDVRNREPVASSVLGRRRDRPVGSPPAYQQQVALVGSHHLERGKVGRDALDLLVTQVVHALVVLGIVVDVAGHFLLGKAADPVLQVWRARDRPGSSQTVRVALEGLESFGIGAKLDGLLPQLADVGDEPGLGAAGEIGVRQDHHRRHVLDGELERLDHRVEAIARRGGGQYGHGTVGVAPRQRKQQIPLLGLGRHAGRRAGPLDVDDDHREFGDHGQTQGFLFQHEARPAGGADRQRSSEGGTDRRAHGRNLVLGLEGLYPEVPVARNLVEDVAGRRDRVGGQKHRLPKLYGRADDAPGQGGVACDVPVVTGLDLGLGHDVRNREELGGLAERMAGLQDAQVGFEYVALELAGEPALGGFHAAVVEPEHHAQGEEVLAAIRVARAQIEVLERFTVEPRQRDLDQPVPVAQLGKWVGLVTGTGQGLAGERVDVDDHHAARSQVADVGLERRRIEGDQYVRIVGGRPDFFRREVDLEARNPSECPRWRTNLGRKVWKGREVVPCQGRGFGELRSGQLHSVARVSREADGDVLDFLSGLFRHSPRSGGRFAVAAGVVRVPA